MKSVWKALLIIAGAGALFAVVMVLVMTSRGISAKAEPGAMETLMARTMRGLAIPRGERDLKNPIANSDAVFASGLAHWADHCAACHGNDGSGDTEIGIGMYPKPPDMRRAPTQELSDGSLFYIIENGIRLTGMPAWGDGTAGSAEGSWHLVHFIRRLPTLTAEDLAKMQELNPRSPGDIRAEEEMRQFLDGAETTPPAPQPSHGHGGK